MINKINLIVDNIFEKIISWRKKIHSNPELSFKEFETSNFIIDTLKTIKKFVCMIRSLIFANGERLMI